MYQNLLSSPQRHHANQPISGGFLPKRNRLFLHVRLPLTPREFLHLPQIAGVFVAVGIEEVWGEHWVHIYFLGELRNIQHGIHGLQRKCLRHGVQHVYLLPDDNPTTRALSLAELVEKSAFATVLT